MDKIFKNITVIGSGAWGTALAQMLAGQHRMDTRVILYARDSAVATDINANHENTKYLKGCPLSPAPSRAIWEPSRTTRLWSLRGVLPPTSICAAC